MEHPLEVDGMSHIQLARKIANLRYDEMQKLLDEVAVMLILDANKDKANNRPQTSAALFEVAEKMIDASSRTGDLWDICKKHMELEDD